jgi:hypothetical protein
MKGVYGLLLALGLGTIGATLNWLYLEQRAREFDVVEFVGIRADTVLQPGDVFREEHFQRVPVAAAAARTLKDSAHLWDERATLVGMPVNRRFEGGDLVMRADIRTPPPKPRPLAENERSIPVAVDSRSFVPSLYAAGDRVSFLFSGAPRLASPEGGSSPEVKELVVGDFEVHSVGDRAASAEVARGANRSYSQENVLQIVVRTQGNDFEPKARQLMSLLGNGYRITMVIRHPGSRAE